MTKPVTTDRRYVLRWMDRHQYECCLSGLIIMLIGLAFNLSDHIYIGGWVCGAGMAVWLTNAKW